MPGKRKENMLYLHTTKMEDTTGSESITGASSVSVSRVIMCHCSDCIKCNEETKTTGRLIKHIQWDDEQRRWSFMLDVCFQCKRCRAAEYSLQEEALQRKWGRVESLPTEEIKDPAEVAENAAEETIPPNATVHEAILPNDPAEAAKHPAEETIPPNATVHEGINNPATEDVIEEAVEEADLPIHPAEEAVTPNTCDSREVTTLNDTGFRPREVMAALVVKDSINKNLATEDDIEQFQVQQPVATLSPIVTVVKVISKGIIVIVKTPHFEVIYINSKQNQFQIVGIINYL
jgi:hypothetical protein